MADPVDRSRMAAFLGKSHVADGSRAGSLVVEKRTVFFPVVRPSVCLPRVVVSGEPGNAAAVGQQQRGKLRVTFSYGRHVLRSEGGKRSLASTKLVNVHRSEVRLLFWGCFGCEGHWMLGRVHRAAWRKAYAVERSA